MFIRRVLVGSSGFLLAATPVVVPAVQKKESGASETAKVCRPSELPIYPPPTSHMVTKVDLDEASDFEKALLEPVGMVRSSVVSTVHQVSNVTSQVTRTFTETTDQFSFIIAYLREEDHEAQRIGATAVGTITGLIFGLRGGIFKKITYGLLGTLGMGSICYPEEAHNYMNDGIAEGKHLAHVAYNFVMGVKPGDPEAEEFLPNLKIPTSFSELTQMILPAKKEPQVAEAAEKKQLEK